MNLGSKKIHAIVLDHRSLIGLMKNGLNYSTRQTCIVDKKLFNIGIQSPYGEKMSGVVFLVVIICPAQFFNACESYYNGLGTILSGTVLSGLWDYFVWDCFVWKYFPIWDCFVRDCFVWDCFVCSPFNVVVLCNTRNLHRREKIEYQKGKHLFHFVLYS